MNRFAKQFLLDRKLIRFSRDIFERKKKDIDHYCSNCNAYIGTYHAGC